MSLNIDLYKQRLDAYKVSGKDGKVDSIKKSIIDNFYNNPSYKKVKINNTDRDVHIVTEGARGLRILCKPNEGISAGEYIVWDGRVFLCTFKHPDNDVQCRGTIQKCNYNLKWIDKANGELNIEPCIEDARTLYTTGVKDEKVIEIPNGMVGIQLPFSDITRRLNRGDEFVFNKTKYKITFYDETNYEGIVMLICTETEPSHLDDMVNEIANRWVETHGEKVDRLPYLDGQEPTEPVEPIEGVRYVLSAIDGYGDTDDSQIESNEWYKYTVKKFIDDVEVTSIFDFSIDNINIATITDATDNEVVIHAKDVVKGGNVKLTIKELGEVVIENVIKIIGL